METSRNARKQVHITRSCCLAMPFVIVGVFGFDARSATRLENSALPGSDIILAAVAPQLAVANSTLPSEELIARAAPTTYRGRTRADAIVPVSIRTTTDGGVEALQAYLDARHSALSAHAPRLLDSIYWSTVIAICTIEEASCAINPMVGIHDPVTDEIHYVRSNNYWGMMCGRRLCQYDSVEAGIDAINTLLEKYEARGLDTVEGSIA